MVTTPQPAAVTRRCRVDRMSAICRGAKPATTSCSWAGVTAHRTLSKEPLLFQTGRFRLVGDHVGRRPEREANLPAWLLISQAQTLAEDGVSAHDPNN